MATNTASASQRSTPRRDSTKYAAVTLTTAAARPIANMTRLFHSANATTTAIATNASTKLSRANQGRKPLAGAVAPRVSADRSDMSVSCPAGGLRRPPVSGEASRRGPRYTRPAVLHACGGSTAPGNGPARVVTPRRVGGHRGVQQGDQRKRRRAEYRQPVQAEHRDVADGHQ